MATAKNAKNAAARVRTKRRERKNIEKGAVHIRSSFNNTMVTITDLRAMPFLGHPQAALASAEARSLPPLLLLKQQKLLQRQLWNTV